MKNSKTDSQSTRFQPKKIEGDIQSIYSSAPNTYCSLPLLSCAATLILEPNPNLFQPLGPEKIRPFLVGPVA